jgi:hypothetical protein
LPGIVPTALLDIDYQKYGIFFSSHQIEYTIQIKNLYRITSSSSSASVTFLFNCLRYKPRIIAKTTPPSAKLERAMPPGTY